MVRVWGLGFGGFEFRNRGLEVSGLGFRLEDSVTGL